MAQSQLLTGHGPLPWERSRRGDARRAPHLVLAWSIDEPQRIGEAIRVDISHLIGRGGPADDDPVPRASLVQMRPGENIEGAPISAGRISRKQLVVERTGDESIRIQSIGSARLRINGAETKDGTANVGDVIEIVNAAVFVLVDRPVELPEIPGFEVDTAFGRPDRFGIVGESEGAWKLRELIAFAASTERHVLVLGESGAGKELAARSIHGLSTRRKETLVARNAATLPESLIDAELFGNVKNYPNPGMPERPGLIGEADGSTLFLDEIGDLPEKCQVHLLRVLDDAGEYQRLGEANARRSSFRLVAATNRAPDLLKHDFLARFTHRIALPGLPERREDIPLVLAELLRRTASTNPAIAARFFDKTTGHPHLAPDFVIRLLRHPFTHHVRELERIVWLALGTADGDFIGITPAVEAELGESASSAGEVDASALDRDTIAAALAEHGRSPTKAAKALGLKNRFVLLRLLKKHGLSASGE